MLPKKVQKVFDDYDKKHANKMKTQTVRKRVRRPLQLDWDFKASDFEYKQLRRTIRITTYQLMAINIIIGLLEAIYFTYLLT